MKSLFVLGTFLTSTLAAPLASWSPALGEFYAAVDRHIQIARQEGTSNPPTCDLSKAVQPAAPTPLPTPDPSWQLTSVVIGRGVQNYTCANNLATTLPVSQGALASLYNVSCIAANYPDILSMLPGLALQYALPADPMSNLEPSNLALVGHHYFSANKTPTFDLTGHGLTNTNTNVNVATSQSTTDFGVGRFKISANSTAPPDAPKGENGVGDGAVPWLDLSAIYGTTSDIKAVYRLNTAGGKAPATCETSPAYFSVQYAAEYWFYSQPGVALTR